MISTFGDGAAMACLEQRVLVAAAESAGQLRSYDGTGNNLLHPDWGAAGTTLLRLAGAAYADGMSAPAGASRPGAREISNTIAAHPADDLSSGASLAAFAYLWGQFIDHDLDLTGSASPAETFNVAVPKGDPYFDPQGTGTQIIRLNRSLFDTTTGQTSPRQQINQITSYLDGSMIYGSDAARAAALRAFVGGRLLVGDNGLLPLNSMGLANANDAHLFPDNQL